MIIDRLKDLDDLTVQEEAVVKYILKNPRALLKMSINDLAIESFTSGSTIVRLCKKAGTRGYVDFKTQYVSEYPEMMKMADRIKDVPFTKASNIDDLIHGIPMIYHRSVDYTRSMLDRATLVRCIHYVKKAKHIGIYGNGLNLDVAKMSQYKFEEVGVNAIAYDSSHWQHITRLQLNQTPAFAILISHTGKNPSILDTAKRLKEAGIPMLAICGKADRRLSALSNETIQIMISDGTLELSNIIFSISTMYVLDILTMAMHVENFEEMELINDRLQGARGRWQND